MDGKFVRQNRRKRERAIGGFIIGIKKGWKSERNKGLREEGKDIVITEIRNREGREGKDIGNTIIIIIMIYNKSGWEEIKDKIDRITEERYTDNIIIGGDFNIRTGNLGCSNKM